jgi:hypothetical protein
MVARPITSTTSSRAHAAVSRRSSNGWMSWPTLASSSAIYFGSRALGAPGGGTIWYDFDIGVAAVQGIRRPDNTHHRAPQPPFYIQLFTEFGTSSNVDPRLIPRHYSLERDNEEDRTRLLDRCYGMFSRWDCVTSRSACKRANAETDQQGYRKTRVERIRCQRPRKGSQSWTRENGNPHERLQRWACRACGP